VKISIQGTNLELSDALKLYVDEKVGHLEQFITDVLEARVELERDAHHHKGPVYRCEVNLDVPRKHILRADCTEADLYAAIDGVVPKLKHQIDKYKEQQKGRDQKLRRSFKSIFPWFK